MIKRTVSCCVLSIVGLSISGCMGGGTVGTGLGFNSPTADQSHSTRTRIFEGSVVNMSEGPVSGAVLHVHTGELFYSTRTGPTGAFSLTLAGQSDRVLAISIEHQGKIWKTRVPFPVAQRVTIRFLLSPDGTILLD